MNNLQDPLILHFFDEFAANHSDQSFVSYFFVIFYFKILFKLLIFDMILSLK